MTIQLASRCLFCDLSGNYEITNICPVCLDTLQRLPHCCTTCALPVPADVDICGQCQKRPPALDSICAACPYESGLDSLIRRLKDGGDFSSLDIFSRLIEERLRHNGDPLPDLIVPIPMHPLKRLWRGFNQTDLIAKKLGKSLDLEVASGTLGRRMSTDQRNLNLANRLSNTRRAFFLKDIPVEGLRVTILDDVMTTGATLNSAARTIKAGGALRVDAWVLARTLKH